jgi:hypothetical protein
MKTRAKTMAVLLLSGFFAASCAATSPPIFVEHEEETMDVLDREYGEALREGQAALAEQEEELTVDDVFRDRAGPGTSTMDVLDREYGETLRGGGTRVED